MGFGLMFPVLVGQLLDAAAPTKSASPLSAWLSDVDTIALVLMGTLAMQAALTFFSSFSFIR
jgi:ATP-binding cassette subfamily B protein